MMVALDIWTIECTNSGLCSDFHAIRKRLHVVFTLFSGVFIDDIFKRLLG